MSGFINEINDLAQQTNAKFITFKFIDSWGRLCQIDSLISVLNFKDGNILIHDLKLAPIKGKIFLDPFRSFSTIFCLCENSSDPYRRSLFKEITETEGLGLECAIEFTASSKININISSDNHDQYNLAADPLDKLANLRSEIVLNLENAGISSDYHYATGSVRSVISFKAMDLTELADNYIIAKYIITNTAESYGKTTDFDTGANKQASVSTITISPFHDNLFIERFAAIQDKFEGKLAFLKLIGPNSSCSNNNLSNKLVMSFNNFTINPYIVFGFLNPYNYKIDKIVDNNINTVKIRHYVQAMIK